MLAHTCEIYILLFRHGTFPSLKTFKLILWQEQAFQSSVWHLTLSTWAAAWVTWTAGVTAGVVSWRCPNSCYAQLSKTMWSPHIRQREAQSFGKNRPVFKFRRTPSQMGDQVTVQSHCTL
jgi:hypothetical protein